MNQVKKYYELTQKIKELQRKRDELKEEIFHDAFVSREDYGKDYVEGNYKAKICERSYGFDQKAFKEERPKLYKQYYNNDKYEYLIVSKINNLKIA